MALPTHRDSQKINMTMEIQPFEAASPITRWWFFQKAILVFGGWYLVQPFCLVKNTLQNVMFWGPSLVVLLPHENGIQVQARHFCCQKNLRRNRLRIAPCEALLPQSDASKLCAKYDCLVYYPWKQKWFHGMNTKKYFLLSLHFSFENVISIRYWDQRSRLSWIPDNHLKLW